MVSSLKWPASSGSMTVRHGVGGGCVTWSHRRGRTSSMYWLTPDVAASPLQISCLATPYFFLRGECLGQHHKSQKNTFSLVCFNSSVSKVLVYNPNGPILWGLYIVCLAQEEEKQIQEASQSAAVLGRRQLYYVLAHSFDGIPVWNGACSYFLTQRERAAQTVIKWGFRDDVMQVPKDEAMASQWATQDLRAKSNFICETCNDSAMILVHKCPQRIIEVY